MRRTHISSGDFEKAGEFIKAAREQVVGAIAYEGLLLSAIVWYARPFSNNEMPNEKHPKTDPKVVLDLPQILGADKDFHSKIVRLRNKAVAHAEFEHYPVDPIPDAESAKIMPGLGLISKTWNVADEGIDLNVFARVADRLRLACNTLLSNYGASGVWEIKATD
jgi:hypothetical protein